MRGPSCGKCRKPMTPQNSQICPEWFLCDDCAPNDLHGIATRKTPLEEAREIIRVFAKYAEKIEEYRQYDDHVQVGYLNGMTVGDFRKAREWLERNGGAE